MVAVPGIEDPAAEEEVKDAKLPKQAKAKADPKAKPDPKSKAARNKESQEAKAAEGGFVSRVRGRTQAGHPLLDGNQSCQATVRQPIPAPAAVVHRPLRLPCRAVPWIDFDACRVSFLHCFSGARGSRLCILTSTQDAESGDQDRQHGQSDYGDR